MCGFAGYIVNGLMGDRKAIIKAMADRIRHRGPDQDDYYLDDDIALGFRRLSIIDLEGGSQPILNEDGSMVLTFNGEIYNFKELREDLIQKGHVFKTHTDSEVLLHGYEEYGSELLQKLRGMYLSLIHIFPAYANDFFQRVVGTAGDRHHGVARPQYAKERHCQGMGAGNEGVPHQGVLRPHCLGEHPVQSIPCLLYTSRCV